MKTAVTSAIPIDAAAIITAISRPVSAATGAAANAAMIASGKSTAGDTVLFTYQSKVYAVVDSGATAGFQDGTDFIVEITGVTGTVTIGDFVTA